MSFIFINIEFVVVCIFNPNAAFIIFFISEERGIDNAFVDQLSTWCSAHEHSQYINLLSEIEKFAKM